jgi:hypothetical protein
MKARGRRTTARREAREAANKQLRANENVHRANKGLPPLKEKKTR